MGQDSIEELIKVPKATLNQIRFYYHRNHPYGDDAGATEGLGSDGGGRRLQWRGTVPSGIGCRPPLSEQRCRLYAGMDVALHQKI